MRTEDDKLNLPSGFNLNPQHTFRSTEQPYRTAAQHLRACGELLWQLVLGATHNDYLLNGGERKGPSPMEVWAIASHLMEARTACHHMAIDADSHKQDARVRQAESCTSLAWIIANRQVFTPTARCRRGSLRRLAKVLVKVVHAQNLPTGPLSIGPSIDKALRHIGGSPDNLHESVQHELIAEVVSLIDPTATV